MIALALFSLVSLVLSSPLDGHHHHDEPQVPFGYVSFPQQFSQRTYYKNGHAIETGSKIPGDGEVSLLFLVKTLLSS